MSASTAILFLDRAGWRLATASSAPGGAMPLDGVGDAADAIRDALAKQGHRSPIVIALDAAACLTATIALDGLPRRERRQAMLYRLEEKLPVAVEDVAVDFVSSRDGRSAFGVATRADALRPMLDALAARGVEVDAIVPTAIVALTTLDDRAAIDVACWRTGDAWEAVALADGRPTGWYALSDVDASDSELTQCFAVLSAARRQPLRLRALGVAAGRLSRDATIESIEATESWSPHVAATRALQSRGDVERAGLWLDLRRDALAAHGAAGRARRPMLWAAAGVVALLGAIGAATAYRALQYERIGAASDRRLEAIYAELFPNTAVPVAVRSRLASEARRLTETTASGPASAAVRPATTRVLVNLLARLPSDARASVNELRIGGDAASVALEGEARSFVDAQALAAALHGSPSPSFVKAATNALLSFEVDAPRTTQRSDRTVSFSMNATPRAPDPRPAEPIAAKPTTDAKPSSTPPPVAKKGKR